MFADCDCEISAWIIKNLSFMSSHHVHINELPILFSYWVRTNGIYEHLKSHWLLIIRLAAAVSVMVNDLGFNCFLIVNTLRSVCI